MGIPIRLSDQLIADAESSRQQSMRTLPKQIEWWATIGKQLESRLSASDMAALINGELEFVAKRSESRPVDFDQLFADLDAQRKLGALSSNVVRDPIWYEESKEMPGYIVRVDSRSGERSIGMFKNGKFEIHLSTGKIGDKPKCPGS